MPASPHIYVNTRQIKYGQMTTNKETNEREWKKYTHSHLVTKDGKPLEMARVYLPNLSKRQKVHGDQALSFGEDINGIDRDSRNAYIQVPACELKDLKGQTKDSKSKLRVIYFNNLEARFNVYFEAKKYDVDRKDPNFNKFDKPVKVNVGTKELQLAFPTTRDEIKRVASQSKEVVEKEKPTEKTVEKPAVAKTAKKPSHDRV